MKRVHKLENPTASAEKLTQSVLQVTDMLGMYQAELARILHLTCPVVGNLANGRQTLIPDTVPWRQAELFVSLYDRLHSRFEGDEVAIYHCLRVHNSVLNGIPLQLLVDELQLEHVLKHFSGS